MIYVYRLPPQLSNGFCFSGPVPIQFANVDWFNVIPETLTREEVEFFIRSKPYFTKSPQGSVFLVLCLERADLTFTTVK